MGKSKNKNSRNNNGKVWSFDIVKTRIDAWQIQKIAERNIRTEEVKKKKDQIKERAKIIADNIVDNLEVEKDEISLVEVLRDFVETEGFHRKR